MVSNAQKAAMIALMIPAIGMPAYVILKGRHTAPNLITRTESIDAKTTETKEYGVKEDPEDPLSIICYKSQKFPFTRKIKFKNEDAKTAAEKVWLGLLKAYRPELGDRGFTSYEILQIFRRNVDRMKNGLDIGTITEEEVAKALEDYEAAKANGADVKKVFDLDLETGPKTSKSETAQKYETGRTNDELADLLVKANKEWENASYNSFNQARRIEEIKKAEYKTLERLANSRYAASRFRPTHYQR